MLDFWFCGCTHSDTGTCGGSGRSGCGCGTCCGFRKRGVGSLRDEMLWFTIGYLYGVRKPKNSYHKHIVQTRPSEHLSLKHWMNTFHKI